MKRLLAILFWSVIAAAFIGPGTVTTAASSGAGFGLRLLWALVFSTFACLLLQEASARLTVVSGRNLGEALREQFHGGARGALVLGLVLGGIVFGCAAYQTGNILGAIEGVNLAFGAPRAALALACGAAAAALLWVGAPKTVAACLSVTVAVMGAAFLVTAALLRPDPGALLRGSLVPALPVGSGVLVLGLIGTTVVPYNLFLGSGMARGQTLDDIRLGLAVSVVAGGIISMGALVVGTAVQGAFAFEALSEVLRERLGGWAAGLVALGLFAAGFSSAITAPLAAAVTARSLFAAGEEDGRWGDRSLRYRAVWMAVLLVGVGFGVGGVKPIPAIILAQALNGVLLPFAAVFLLLAVNDRRLMGEAGLNGGWANAGMAVVVLVTLVLGVNMVAKALGGAAGLPALTEGQLLLVSAAAAAALAVPVGIGVGRRRGAGEPKGDRDR